MSTAFPPAPMSPHLLDLSTELVIQILAFLSLRDIGACALTCRQLNGVISSSQYLQYLVRTKIAGVHDPFIIGPLTLHDRLTLLERWEHAWHSLDLSEPALQCVVPRDISVGVLRYEMHDGYLVAIRRFPVDDRPMGYSFISLHDSVQNGAASWSNINLPESLSAFSYCFSAEEHNLSALLVFEPDEDPEPHGSLKIMSFLQGTDHPFATTPMIPMRMNEKTMGIFDAYDVQMAVAGDNIIIMVTQARALPDYVLLVNWKLGNVSTVLAAPDLTFAPSFALLNTDILALVNLQSNTLDIHRIVDGNHRSLQLVRQLLLPPLLPSFQPLSASFSLAQTRSSVRPTRPRCLPFYPSPDACFVGLSVVLIHDEGNIATYWLAIRRDYLWAQAHIKCGSDGLLPWNEWGPYASCCMDIDRPLSAPIPAGARWLVHSQSLIVREFGLSRSRRVQADREVAEGPGEPILPGVLEDVFASQLPSCDITSVGDRKYQSVTADHEWVVGMNEERDEFDRKNHRIDIHHVM
ncbi:hypothetical protein BC834DRAFT_972445 [Gloeopeniophorella convolvens]|nr:hypothetical protein BC834DRAFT_972445 [Gloeopeniophorella convolvens]